MAVWSFFGFCSKLIFSSDSSQGRLAIYVVYLIYLNAKSYEARHVCVQEKFISLSDG